jgi:hypothetical protein
VGYDIDWVEPSDDDNESYFRIGMGSMSPLWKVLEARGMGHRGRPKESVYDPDIVAFRLPETKGIPLMKLGSNDGWLVHPEEITEALAIHDTLPPVTDADFGEDDRWDTERWDRWITFLRGAATHGGFKVW